MEEEDPLDAYMKKIDVKGCFLRVTSRPRQKPIWKNQVAVTVKTCSAISKRRKRKPRRMRKRRPKTKLQSPPSRWMISCMASKGLLNRKSEKTEDDGKMDEEEDEKYHQAFKEAMQRAVAKRESTEL